MSDEFIPPLRQDPHLVQQFLEQVRGAVPLDIEQIDMMLRLISAAREKLENFLDLGCGDGVLSAALLGEHPYAQGIAVDHSSSMLDVTRGRLETLPARMDFIQTDFRLPGWTPAVADFAPFDAIASGFSIHHLPNTRKRELYQEVFELLGPEGIFINIEHVASATRWTESLLDDYMISAIFGEQLRACPGQRRVEVARAFYEQSGGERSGLAPLEVQLDWLREIGFQDVECYFKVQELAVFGGQRPGLAGVSGE
ncbi:MAG: class I SAM-dependent methyltransferase [Verrucomicrobiota bacterium]|nr:class I SAM-dependent methyltransferase [Verrucomicrobiota bacterium]